MLQIYKGVAAYRYRYRLLYLLSVRTSTHLGSRAALADRCAKAMILSLHIDLVDEDKDIRFFLSEEY